MDLVNYVCSKVVVLRSMRDDEKGVTALEYGLVAAFVAIALTAALATMGSGLSNFFKNIGLAASGTAVSITP